MSFPPKHHDKLSKYDWMEFWQSVIGRLFFYGTIIVCVYLSTHN